MRNKIVVLSVCLMFALSWVGVSVSPFFKYTTEKKVALQQSEIELEEKIFEVVYNLSPAFTPQLQTNIEAVLSFSKNINFPESLTLDSSKPPPELNC